MIRLTYKNPEFFPEQEGFDWETYEIVQSLLRGESLHSEFAEDFPEGAVDLRHLKVRDIKTIAPRRKLLERVKTRLPGIEYIGTETDRGGYWAQTAEKQLTWVPA